ncbi:hypothetical protein N1851_009374 [Merluccius polli]|uniref:Uncharacterized protein n=1 Tax=Merluccius polli TaxID=89951 RepID=A0AA47N193_MERPO|nr:hypothetical protein N1851_009374 [Merluccius polli]
MVADDDCAAGESGTARTRTAEAARDARRRCACGGGALLPAHQQHAERHLTVGDDAMALVNFLLFPLLISTVGKCIDVLCFLLDLNFVVVHTVVRSVLAVFAFVNHLPC